MSDNYTHIASEEELPADPAYQAGDQLLFRYPLAYDDDDKGYREHSDQQITIVRSLIHPDEYENLGDPMYRIRAADGWEGDAWESELTTQC